MTLKDRQFEKIILNGWNLFKDILITGRQNVIDQKMDEFLTTCVKGTDDCLFKLVEEIVDAEIEITNLTCQTCKRNFSRSSSLKKHMHEIHNVVEPEAPIVQQEPQDPVPGTSRDLCYKERRKNKNIHCPQCGKFLISKLALENHVEEFHRENIGSCNEEISSTYENSASIEISESIENTVPGYEESVPTYEESIPSNENVWKIDHDYCNEISSQPASQNETLCDHCGEFFTSYSAHLIHMELVHKESASKDKVSLTKEVKILPSAASPTIPSPLETANSGYLEKIPKATSSPEFHSIPAASPTIPSPMETADSSFLEKNSHSHNIFSRVPFNYCCLSNDPVTHWNTIKTN